MPYEILMPGAFQTESADPGARSHILKQTGEAIRLSGLSEYRTYLPV